MNNSHTPDSTSLWSGISTAKSWARAYISDLTSTLFCGWDRFWFRPRSSYWLSVLRIPAGLMLLYSHLVWGLAFEQFLGENRVLSPMFAAEMNPSPWYWSHFDWITHSMLLWGVHWLAIVSFLCFTVGLAMPWTGWIATAFAISYAHRATGALFGLDQMNVALVMYLTLGGAGKHLSVDRFLRKRQLARQGRAEDSKALTGSPVEVNIWSTIATRLLQIQLCIVYWFAGTGKLQGVSWWNGEAMWGAFASYQYQSIEMTWLYPYPHLLAFLTHATIIWEVSYVFLVWPRWSRPLVIGAAVLVHSGIGIFLGMMTFGYIMVIANLAFVEWNGLWADEDVDMVNSDLVNLLE